MVVLSEKFPGRIYICDTCGALLAYNDKDVYGNQVYCPLCKQPHTLDYDKNYNGVVENKGENK